jgi:peroxiredoxin
VRLPRLNSRFRCPGLPNFGLSAQEPDYQRELAERLELPFPILSEARLLLSSALRLPTFTVARQILLTRIAWVQDAGRIARVFYLVFPSDRNADEVLSWLAAQRRC